MISPAVLSVDFKRAADAADLLVAPVGKVRFLNVPERRFLAIDGAGAPGEAQFKEAMAALYPVAWTLHFALKERGLSAPIGTLEGLYGDDSGIVASSRASDSPALIELWSWRLQIPVPSIATDDDVAGAIEEVAGKKAPAALPRLRVERWAEGPSAQTMHVGPYDAETETVALLLQAIADQGLQPAGRHHEIYISDPNRTRPDHLKTIIRMPVRPA